MTLSEVKHYLIDPKLKDTAKLKDLSDMSKEEAKEELIEITKSFSRKRAVISYFVTCITPVLLWHFVILLF
ncbi:hypothetical protein ACO2FA_13505 [Staphylococcus warneri]